MVNKHKIKSLRPSHKNVIWLAIFEKSRIILFFKSVTFADRGSGNHQVRDANDTESKFAKKGSNVSFVFTLVLHFELCGVHLRRNESMKVGEEDAARSVATLVETATRATDTGAGRPATGGTKLLTLVWRASAPCYLQVVFVYVGLQFDGLCLAKMPINV
ncbi:hypothetical protein Zmor_008083 [Zophobas morio]|uniref:Uncharacterized protein n=1 Tax=Zophobas morio TaxID=2755281 RepID=A0AA38MQ21_9CUCU|nr:hypothetical protein Zmor_008083 [Zophobas morio]